MSRTSTLGRRVVRTADGRRGLGQPGWPSNFGGGFVWGNPRGARPVAGPRGMAWRPFSQGPGAMIRGPFAQAPSAMIWR